MKSITFYKLVSPYPEDVTKNCGLSGVEIDKNFMNLKEMDITSAMMGSDDTLILKRVDGETLNVDLSPIISGAITSFSVSYDETHGVLIIKHNDQTDVISGLCTIYTNKAVYSNKTLQGDGIISSPLHISPVFLTGQYSPCKEVIDLTISGNTLPTSGMVKGDRYLTKEKTNIYGYLYNFCQVGQIDKYLEENYSEWRIPTKEDWDNILNAAEDCDMYRDHGSVGNGLFGKIAGKKMKDREGWEFASATDDSNSCEVSSSTCDSGSTPPTSLTPDGIDSYGMHIVPAGYGFGFNNRNYNLFGEEGAYWTSTIDEVVKEAYTKTFDYNKTKVGQELTNADKKYYCSIRLVKDWTGGNNYPTENIAGINYDTALLPTLDSKGLSGYSIWTSSNFVGFSNLKPIVPNGGDLPESAFTPIYYTNEWDGSKWLINTLPDGYSVVLTSGVSGETDNEYRNVNGVLTNVSDIVYERVLEILSATTFKDIYEKIDIISGDLKTEIENRISGDTLLQENIDKEISARTDADKTLQDNIDKEVQDRKDADEVEKNERISADTEEKEARILADNKEISARTAADDALQLQITDNKNHLISGGTFNCSGGTLTLDTVDSANTITILFNSNYGLYPYNG